MNRQDSYQLFSQLRENEISTREFLELLAQRSGMAMPEEGQHFDLKSVAVLNKKGKELTNKLLKHVSGFALNTYGISSFLVIGISNLKRSENHIFTLKQKKVLERVFSTHQENYVNPPATVEYVIRPYANGEVAVVRIFGDERPRRCEQNGTYYFRRGAKTEPLDEVTVKEMISACELRDTEKPVSRAEFKELVKRAITELYASGVSPMLAQEAKKGNLDAARKLVKGKADISVIRMAEARQALQSGKLEEARRLYSQAIVQARDAKRLDIEAVALAELAARVCAQVGDTVEAETYIGQAFCLADAHRFELPELYYYRGNLKGSRGDTVGAISDYTEALRLRPKMVVASSNRGVAKLETKDYDGAIDDFRLSLNTNPNDLIALNGIGTALSEKGSIDEGIAHLDRAIDLDSSIATLFNNRGNAKLAKGDFTGAIADYDAGIRLNPDMALLYCNRGDAKRFAGYFDAAIEDYGKAVMLRPNYPDAYNNRGAAKHKKRNFDGAIADYTKAIEFAPDHAKAYNNRGLAKFEKRDYREALKDFSEAIRLNPNYGEAFISRADSKFFLQDINGAIEDYDKGLRLRPDHSKGFNNRGNVKAAKGDFNGAIADYTVATELDREYYDAVCNRAAVRLTDNDSDGAIADARESLGLVANPWRAWLIMSLAYISKGSKSECLEALGRALSIDPNVVTWINKQPAFKHLRGDPDFEKLTTPQT